MKLSSPSPADLDLIYLMGYDIWSEGRSIEDYLTTCRINPEYQQGSWLQLVNDDGIPTASLIVYELPAIGRYKVTGFGCIATAPAHRRQGHAALLIDLVLRQRCGDNAVFLFSDIDPSYYEKFGFFALPPDFQQYPKSVCMVKLQNGATLDDLLLHHGQLPAYF